MSDPVVYTALSSGRNKNVFEKKNEFFSLSFADVARFVDVGSNRAIEPLQSLGDQGASANFVLARGIHVPYQFPDGRFAGN